MCNDSRAVVQGPCKEFKSCCAWLLHKNICVLGHVGGVPEKIAQRPASLSPALSFNSWFAPFSRE